ncbi:MAG: hypothetical protein AB7S38_00425 [Vulcanimicrobiota bacterium]
MNKRAFTLVETIFSALFISLVVLAIMNLYPAAMVAVKRSEGRIQANLLAQSVLERMRTENYDSLAPGPGPAFAAETHDGTTYTPTVTIFDPDTTPGSDFTMGLRVQVQWEVKGQQYAVTQETLVSALHR